MALPLWLLVLLAMSGCSTAPPAGVAVVAPFDVNRYAGTWYEIARLDHRFERGLSDVSARYRLQPDGGIEVINRGYNDKQARWKQAVGHARFIGSSDRASLEVSFFGPFYGGYHVVALDTLNYRWAMVMGSSRDYLWILARDQQLAPDVRAQLTARASALGVDVGQLIWVEHRRPDPAAVR